MTTRRRREGGSIWPGSSSKQRAFSDTDKQATGVTRVAQGDMLAA